VTDHPSDLTEGMTGTGVTVAVDGDRIQRASNRFNEQLRVARLAGEHVWVATVAHRVDDPTAAVAGQLHLDAESIVYAGVGCFICETPYEPRMLTRRCKGEPR